LFMPPEHFMIERYGKWRPCGTRELHNDNCTPVWTALQMRLKLNWTWTPEPLGK
jgi:hypothetical protein